MTALLLPKTKATIAVHPPPASRDHISYSSITTYQRCPLQYYFRYVLGLEPEFVPANLILGTSIHAALEHLYLCRMEGRADPTPDELLNVYDKTWRSQATRPVRYGKNESQASLRQLAERMLSAFQSSELSNPDGTLIGVEEELRAPIIDGCPELVGRIDLIVLSGDTLRVIDFKTSRARWSDTKVEEASPQLLLYLDLVWPIVEATEASQLQLEWLVLTKTKEPAVEVHRASPDPRRMIWVRSMIRQAWKAIAAEHFYPNPSTVNCSSCPYAKACSTWRDSHDQSTTKRP